MNDFVGKASEKLKKLSDEEVERIFSNMHEQINVYDSILESLSSGIIVVDKNWKIIRNNKAVKRLIPFSYHYHEKNDVLWNLIDNEEISSFIKKTATSNLFNAAEDFSIASENSVLFIMISILPLVKKSDIAGSIILVRDITAKRQQEILLHRMDSLQSLTNLAASVAHEIKNPLGAISIHIQLLQKSIKKCRQKDGLLPNEKFMENYLDVVNEEIDSLNRIVMDFLFAVRPVKVQLILSNPDEIIEKTMEFFRPELEQNNILLSIQLCKETRLLIDDKLLREVIVNLVQNAKSAVLSRVDENGSRIIVKSFIKNENYILTIADNGSGMDHDTCEHIFEPYWTTKSNGTGLGLTTVYKIVNEFHGEISVTSELNRGTVFTVSIPIPQKSTMLLETR